MLVDTSTLRSQSQPDGPDLYFVDFMKSVEELHGEQNPIFNDALITCGRGTTIKQYRVPAVILAAISPIYKVNKVHHFFPSTPLNKQFFP